MENQLFSLGDIVQIVTLISTAIGGFYKMAKIEARVDMMWRGFNEKFKVEDDEKK